MKELTDLIATLQRINTALDNETRVMTCGEAAFILNKRPQTISHYIAQGKLHKASANGVIGVRANEVYQLLWK